jgi:hypothetical protein
MKGFILKQLLKSKMKNVPEDQQEEILGIIEKNPELFQKIATEAKAEMDNGVPQMDAMMKVAKKYEDELKNLKKQ